MKKAKKLVAALVAGTILASTLTGCKVIEKVADEMVTTMLKWELDSTYLNQHDDNYMKLCNITKEEAEEIYWDGIAIDVETFCYYWGIVDGEYTTVDDLDPELADRLTTLMDSISKKAKYEVQSASAMDSSSYSIKVIVSPIDIMEQANTIYNEDSYEPLAQFWTKSESLDFEAMSDEEYIAYCNEYGTLIVQMVEELLPSLGYMEDKSLLVQVESVNDMWEFNEDDMSSIYENVVYYPYE